MKQTIFNAVVGAIGAAASWAWGGWSDLLGFFLLAIVVDYVTGVLASIKEGGGLNSEVGFWGLTRKGLMFIVILIAHHIDLLMGTNVIMTGAIYFYLANELLSIVENYGRLGLPLPDQVKQVIAVIKNRGAGNNQDNANNANNANGGV